jgi:hypothetical protein
MDKGSCRVGRGSARSEMCKTNPIWPRRRVNAQNKPNPGHRTKKSGGDAQPIRLSLRAGSTKSEECKTNPIWPRRGWAPQAKRAKRSQTWVNWGMWAKVIVVWAVARPGSEMCKTNPIGWLGSVLAGAAARVRSGPVRASGKRLTASLPTPAQPAGADATGLRAQEGDLQEVGVSGRHGPKDARISASLAIWRGEGLFGSARA